jgi:hypothetical protein
MCYSDDDRLNTFTNLQARRMWGALDATGTYGPGTRSVLVSPTNLTATGVGTTTVSGCVTQTDIITGIFNYAFASSSSCSAVTMQFTNPISLGFSSATATTYSWNYGDGSSTYTTTTSPTSHTYTPTSTHTFVVSCTAINGTVTNTYSTVINTSFNVQIIGQSSQTGSVTTSTVCKGSEQTIFINFGAGVPSALLTDGTYTYTVTNYMNLAIPETIPYYFIASTTGSYSYSLSPTSCNAGNDVATFNVIDCCPTLITNGDFESTYTTTPIYGFATDLQSYTTCTATAGFSVWGVYDVNTLGSGYFGTSGNPTGTTPWNSLLYYTQHATGKVMQIDGFSGPNSNVSAPSDVCCLSPSPAPRIWQQTVTGLQPNTPYFYSFKILENFKNESAFFPTNMSGLNFETSIASNTITALPAQTFTPVPFHTGSYGLIADWVVYTYTFATTASVTPSMTFSVTINQINNFHDQYFDGLLDNITLNAMTPGIQATGSATICPTATVQLNALINCANASNYTYAWSPATALTNTAIANPVANPTTTTVYTLTAAPISNPFGLFPVFITTTTVTVNSSPSISISGNTALCPGTSSTTLTASGANTYTWSANAGSATTASVIVTPTVTTTYTVSGTATSCSVTGTQTITVTVNNTATTISVTPSATSICVYNTAVNLTASGATTYTWFPAATLSSNSTASVTATPATSTTYTVMGTTNGCIGTNTVSVTVLTSIPALTVTPTSTTICSGQPCTFTVSGATTYTWSTGANTTTITISPTTPTTASVVGSYTNGCSNSKTVSINVIPTPSLTVVAAPASICIGQPTTLVASGASTYTWSANAGSAQTANVTVTPTVATTYSVTGTSSVGCTGTKTVSVAITTTVACSGTAPTYTPVSSYTLTTAPTLVSSNIQVNSGINYIINSTEVRMSPGISINVASGGTLTVKGSWIHACSPCGSMWAGITVANGGTLYMESASGFHGRLSYNIIEDAVKAVTTAINGTTTAVPYYSISNTIFNNNGDDIYINAHTQDLSSNNVSQCIFTCRNLNNHSLLATNFSALQADIRAATPLLVSTTNPLDYTLNGTRSVHGVYISNQTYSINIGDPTLGSNVFDNHDFGIYASGGSLVSKNCKFQNLTGNTHSAAPIGVGIYADDGEGRVVTLQAGNVGTSIDNTERDTFINCMTGVYTNKLLKEFINNNYFNNETTASATSFTTSGAYVTGQFGVYNKAYASHSNTVTPEQMILANNNVNNYATGFSVDFVKLFNTTAQTTLISTNTITAVGTTTNYCNYGISTGQSTTQGANTGVPSNAYDITNNTITNVSPSCIYVNSVNTSTATSGFLIIDGNTDLSIKPNTYTVIQSPRVAAVRIDNSFYTQVNKNTNIHCTNLIGTPYGQYQAGVYVTQSPHTGVTCNTLTNLGEGVVFESTNPTSVYSNNMSTNYFDYSRYGFVLRSGGIIGDQGGSNLPHDNLWGSSNNFIGHTLSDNSFPATIPTSKLYCRPATCTTTTTYMPCTNLAVSGGAVYATGTTLLSTTGTYTLALCTPGGGNLNGRMAANHVDSIAALDSAYYKNIQSAIGNNTFTYPVYDVETRWALQHYVSSHLPTVAAAQGYENAKKLALADAAFAGKDYGMALSLTKSFNPSNVIESNWQTVNSVLAKMQTDTLNQNDVSNLQQVAAQCHLTGGSIVWRARALLNAYYNTIIEYPEACPVNNENGNKVQNTAHIANATINSQSVNLYPNPNNGKMLIDYNLLSDGQLRISDVTGKIIGTYTLNATERNADINMESLQNGVYLYTVINEQGLVKTGRIVIMK